MTDNLKLIAVLVPEPLAGEIREEQEFIARTWGPKHVLRSPPHITLIPTLDLKADEQEKLRTISTEISKKFQPFQLILNGYGSFRSGVLYIRIEPSIGIESLYRIWRNELMIAMPHVLANYPDKPYVPHLTLAHRDVNPSQFKSMWDYYRDKTYSGSVEVKSFWILKHDEAGWTPEMEFVFP